MLYHKVPLNFRLPQPGEFFDALLDFSVFVKFLSNDMVVKPSRLSGACSFERLPDFLHVIRIVDKRSKLSICD